MYMKHMLSILKAVSLIGRESGATVRELQDELRVSRRTVYRVLTALQALNVPLYDDKQLLEHEKRWRVEARYLKRLPSIDVPQIALTHAEGLLLSFLLSGEGVLRKTALGAQLRSLRAKLAALAPAGEIPRESWDKLDSLFIRSQPFSKDYSGKEELIDQLADAIVNQATCLISYHAFSTDKVTAFRVDPLRFVEHAGGLYVFVRVTRHSDIRILAVERIGSLEATQEHFAVPADFDAEGMLESAFGLTFGDTIAIRVWFAVSVARYIRERRWGGDQTIEERPDGSLVLSITTSGAFDVKRWVLSYGSAARLLEPSDLADDIRRELQGACTLYDTTLS